MAKVSVGTLYFLKRADLAVRGCVEAALSAVDLTPTQYLILLLVKTGEATSSAELARAMGMLPQSMTELVAPLEKKGLIVRRPDSNNNRILRTHFTAPGNRVFKKGTEIALQIERELLEDFEEKDLAVFNRMLTALTAKAEEHSFHPKLRQIAKAAMKSKSKVFAVKK